MNTRAASASLHRRFKRELVRLLFGGKQIENYPDSPRLINSTRHSYADLKKAYLDRIQIVHPDKLHHGEESNDDRKARHDQFVELQEAWDRYNMLGKTMQNFGNSIESDFTMFGVGCSFSDSPEERARREEITDQACKGWFSTGALEEKTSTVTNTAHQNKSQNTIRLCDDSLFVESKERCSKESDSANMAKIKPSLIVGGFKRRL
mmetsp:Transcript_19893/g.29506  ORF Transcript_19893/g.29506 Transcript_19893/m.29506 type:complete len:206 (-) Transcript_19893:459-1076(-)